MSNFSSLNCSDIPGAQSRQLVRNKISKTYSSLGNEDIVGTKPRKFYCNSQRELLSLRTDDITGAQNGTYYEKFVRKSPRNPNEGFEHPSPLGTKGKCELKYFGPPGKSRFLRDNMVIDDIPGATKRDKYGHIATRDNNKCDDIPGASVKVYHKIYYDK